MERTELLSMIIEARANLETAFQEDRQSPVRLDLGDSQGDLTLHLMAGPAKADPLAVYTRRSDGTLAVTLGGQPHHGIIALSPTRLQALLQSHLQRRAEHHARSLFTGTADTGPARPSLRAQRVITEAIRGTASTAVHQLASNGTTLKITQETNRLLLQHLVDGDTARTLDMLSSGHDPELQWMDDDALLCTVDEYNMAAPAAPALALLHHSNPDLAEFYLRKLAPTASTSLPIRPAPTGDPADLIADIKAHMLLSDPAWHIFAATAASFNSPSDRVDGARARLTCELLARANAPGAGPERLRTAVLAHQYAAPMMLAAPQGDHWNRDNANEAWVCILNRYLNAEGPPEYLLHVGAAFQNRLITGQPWAPGTWDQLLARADNWHQQLQRDRPADTE